MSISKSPECGDFLGKGSYGTVYECEDVKGVKKAVKCIDMQGKYRSIVEASIMTSYKHPYLASADKILVNGDNLYIIQRLAQCDLAKVCQGCPLPLEKVKKYIYCISKAIYFLHSRNIIHCDIKASNILIYENDIVKLSDFSLSTIALNSVYIHKTGTPSHKAPELCDNRTWSFPIDLWALGCTVYELAYGKNFFPKQRDCKGYKADELHGYAILDWITTQEKIRIDTYKPLISVPFKRVSHNKEYYNINNRELNKFINSLVRYNPDDRLTIKKVLEHPFLTMVQLESPIIIKKRNSYELSVEETCLINSVKVPEPQKTIAVKLLKVCLNMKHLDLMNIYQQCIVIAHVVTKTQIPRYYTRFKPLAVLEHLDYSFHELI